MCWDSSNRVWLWVNLSVLLSALSCVAIIHPWVSSDPKVTVCSAPWAFLKRTNWLKPEMFLQVLLFLPEFLGWLWGVCVQMVVIVGKRNSELRKTIVCGGAYGS